MFGQLAVCCTSSTEVPILSWTQGHIILWHWSKRWLRTNRLISTRPLTWLSGKSFRLLWYTRIGSEPPGGNFGWLVSLLRRSRISRGILTTLEMWPSLPTGWPNSFGRVGRTSRLLKWKTKSSSTLSLNFSLRIWRWLCISSTRIKTTGISSILSASINMNPVKSSSMRSRSHILSTRSISAASKNHFKPKKLTSRSKKKNPPESVLSLTLTTLFELVTKFCCNWEKWLRKRCTRKRWRKISRYGLPLPAGSTSRSGFRTKSTPASRS